MITVKFMEWNCIVNFKSYSNGRTAIQLLSNNEDQDLIAVASVNLADVSMEKDEIAIKDYSENEGMLHCLVKAGIVSQPIRYRQSGFVKIPICKLLVKPEK